LAYAGIISAIMSTADSFSNIGAAVLARDLPRAFGRRGEPTVTRSRIFSVIVFGLALLFALSVKGLVAYAGILGFGLFAAALAPLLAIGLNWLSASVWSARAALVTGTTAAVTGEIMSRLGVYPFELPSACLAVVLSFIVFLATGLLSSARTDTHGLARTSMD
jgi:Na+/proline symporter